MKGKKQKQKQHKDKILNSIPIFLAKTYRIVDNPDYADTIQWIPEENGFIVKNITDLTEKIFPRHFKHTNYASFVRQLNLYGFHKVRSSEEGQIFTHSYFQKNNPDLLPMIKRKNATPAEEGKLQKSSELVLRNAPSHIMSMPSADNGRNVQLEKELGSLTQKHESLQNLVSVLVEQNKQIIMQNKSFINKINSIDDGYRKKLQTLIFLMVFGLKNGDNNIIVPQQLHNMIKAFTTGRKDKNSRTKRSGASDNSQAVELFKKPDESRFYNKNIEEILQMLKMESEGDNSELEQFNADASTPIHEPLESLDVPSEKKYQPEESLMHQGPQLSPIPLMRMPSQDRDKDWHDLFDNSSDFEIEPHKE